MHHMFLKGQHGQGIIQILVSVAILGILTMAFATMMNNQWRETRALTEKLAASDLQQLLTASLADGSVCSYVLNNPTVLTFDSTQPLPQTINLTNPTAATAALYLSIVPNAAPPPATLPGPIAAQVGQPASPTSNTLVVQSIQLQITAGSGNSYAGKWLVTFDPTKTIRSVRPFRSKLLSMSIRAFRLPQRLPAVILPGVVGRFVECARFYVQMVEHWHTTSAIVA